MDCTVIGARPFIAAEKAGQIQRGTDLECREAHLCLLGIVQAEGALAELRRWFAFEARGKALA